jgi:hypothetical protein
MNAHRVAHLLRQLADEIDVSSATTPANDAPKRRKPRKKAPVLPATEIDIARARQAAQRLGILLP